MLLRSIDKQFKENRAGFETGRLCFDPYFALLQLEENACRFRGFKLLLILCTENTSGRHSNFREFRKR